MAITFPTTLDVLTNPLSTDPPNNPSHSQQHADANDAIEALEAKVGINGSAVTSSLDYLLKNSSSSDPGHRHSIAHITLLQESLDTKAVVVHSHAIGDVVGLQTALDGKAATSHTHAIADVTGLQTALDGKASSSHTHAIADVTGLQTALDGKASSSHTHAIADVTGLQTALDTKSDTSHTHTNITVATTTDTTCSVLLSDDATGSIQPKTDPGITYNATSNALTITGTFVANIVSANTMLATTFTGNLAGNASSASFADVSPAGALTGTTLAANVVSSSLTSVGTLATLTVTATITGSVSGNAGTATKLATARAINGTDFDGTAPITITAAAGTLTGDTLAVNVLTSSLTSVGTITVGVWSATVIAPTKGGTGLTGYTVGDLLYCSATDVLSKLAVGARAGMSLRISGGLPVWADDIIILEHQETQNTAGGTFTSGADRVATINTEVLDDGGHCSLASNQFTLVAGTYRIFSWTKGHLCDRWRSWLYNTSDSAIVLLGSCEWSTASASAQMTSVIQGRFTITATKTFEIRKRCQTTRATTGYGVETNFTGVEIYTRVVLDKIA